MNKIGIATIALVSALVLFAVSVAPVMADPTPPTPYIIKYGQVFYANGSECNGPIVNVTNLNTSEEWEAETYATSHYYELVLANGTDVNVSEVLQFDAKDPAETQFNTTDHTVTQTELNDGGVFNFNITLKEPIVTTYDFATGAGTDKWAYKPQVDAKPPATNDVPDTEFRTFKKRTEYDKIKTDNRKMQSDSSETLGCYAAHRFVFNIAEQVRDIKKIGVLWNGKGTHTDRNKPGATLYIWNGSAYEQLDMTISKNEVYLTGEITVDCKNYIDATTGNLMILVEQNYNHTAKGKRELVSKISTDYVKVDISHVT